MRAPSIDYSATRRAISTDADLKAYSHLGDKIKNTQDRLSLSQKSIDVAEKHLGVQTGLQIAQEAISFAKTAVSIGNDIYKQHQSDLVAAKTTDLSSEAAIRITESVNGNGNEIIEDAEGNLQDIKLDPALTQWFDDQIASIESDSSLGKAAKQSLISNLNKMKADSKIEVYNQYINSKVAALDTVEQDLLSRAVLTDIGASAENRSTYGDYAAADAYIQNNKNWSVAQKQAKTIQAHNAIDLGRAKNDVQQVAITQGYDSAVSLARNYQGLYGWAADSQEYKSLLSIAQVEDANETLRLTNAASAAMTNGLNSMASDPSLSPEGIYDQIKASMDGQPQSRIDAAIQAAKSAHISWATGVTSKVLATVTTDTRDELLLEQAALEQMNDGGYFSGGAESVYTSAQTTVQKYIDAWNTYYGSAETASQKELAARVSNIKSATDMIVSGFTDGTVSAESAVLQMQGILSLYNLDDTFDDDLYIQKMIQQVEDNVVPAQYKDTVKNWKESFYGQVASAMGYPVNLSNSTANGMLGALDSSQRADVETAVTQAYASVLDLFRQTAAVDMTPAMLNSKLQSISDIFTADVFSALGGGVKDATFFKDSNAKDAMNAFAEHPDIVYYNSKTGRISWLNEDFEKSYNEMADWCAQDLEAKGIILEGSPKIYTDENGVHPFPVFTSKSGKQILYNNEGIYVLSTGKELDIEAEKEESAEAAVKEVIENTKAPATVIEPNFDIPSSSLPKKDLPALPSAFMLYRETLLSGDEDSIQKAKEDLDAAIESEASKFGIQVGSKEINISDEDRAYFSEKMAETLENAKKNKRTEDEARVLADPAFPSQLRPVSLWKLKASEGSEFKGDVGEAVEAAEVLSDVLPQDMAAEVSPDCAISIVSKDSAVEATEEQWYSLNISGMKDFYHDQIEPTVNENIESMKDKEYSLTPSGLAGFFSDLFSGVGK
jgi:hypothetical protein